MQVGCLIGQEQLRTDVGNAGERDVEHLAEEGENEEWKWRDQHHAHRLV